MPTLTQLQAEKARRERDRHLEHVRKNSDLVRVRCQSLHGFIREAWSILEPASVFLDGWHIRAICLHLEAITNGEFLAMGRDNRLLINVPPGTMKSLIVSVFWPAWEWGPRGLPSMRYLTASYNEGYAKRDARKMRDLVTSEWYQALWPIELIRAGETSFETKDRGGREAKPFVSLTGGRGDRVIIDDPHSTETAESESERDTTTRIFRESITSRLNDPVKSAIIVVMQRLHEKDVSGQILALKLGYTHLMLPMEFEPERKCVTPLFEDPRTADGELLFPERFPRATVDRDKATMGGYAVAGQFQQRPAPREGGLFKRGWFKIIDDEPAGITSRLRRWDLAATLPAKGKEPDWTAGVLMGVTDDKRFVVLDVKRTRDVGHVIRSMIETTAEQDGQGVRIRIPQDPGQAGKDQAQIIINSLTGFAVQAERETGSKETRAESFAIQAEAGNVLLLRGAWNEAFIDELSNFPAGQFDDQVDAAAGAFNALAVKPARQPRIRTL